MSPAGGSHRPGLAPAGCNRLVAIGFDERRAVLAIHMTAILLSLLAFVTFYLPPVIANIIFGLLLLAGVVVIILLERYT